MGSARDAGVKKNNQGILCGGFWFLAAIGLLCLAACVLAPVQAPTSAQTTSALIATRVLPSATPLPPTPTATPLPPTPVLPPTATPNPYAAAFRKAASWVQPKWRELQHINPDIQAWIYNPAIGLDHPILQSADNLEYLTLSFDQKYDPMGSLFFDYRVAGGMKHKNMIVYGHNFDNQRMFSNLVRYRDPSFAAENPYVYVYTPDSIFRAEAARTFVSGPTDATYLEAEFPGPYAWPDYLKRLEDSSLLQSGIKLSPQDQLLTLYTCINNAQDERFVWVGKMIKLGDYAKELP